MRCERLDVIPFRKRHRRCSGRRMVVTGDGPIGGVVNHNLWWTNKRGKQEEENKRCIFGARCTIISHDMTYRGGHDRVCYDRGDMIRETVFLFLFLTDDWRGRRGRRGKERMVVLMVDAVASGWRYESDVPSYYMPRKEWKVVRRRTCVLMAPVAMLQTPPCRLG